MICWKVIKKFLHPVSITVVHSVLDNTHSSMVWTLNVGEETFLYSPYILFVVRKRWKSKVKGKNVWYCTWASELLLIPGVFDTRVTPTASTATTYGQSCNIFWKLHFGLISEIFLTIAPWGIKNKRRKIPLTEYVRNYVNG